MDDRLRARWPGREPGNRLEPDCRPLMRPSFELDPSKPVFTIGSCFARNVERRLKARGFDVPAIGFIQDHPEVTEGQGTEVLNKYTPPSIYQELAWTRRIRDRDDKVTADDVEPLLLELPNGKVLDMHRRTFRPDGITREQALAVRQLFYSLFRRAFDCPSLVITLGLIECWMDNERKNFVEFNPSLLTKKQRFSLHVLDYIEALDHVQKSVDLLRRDRKPKILLTTSPVPLNRTFTEDDVIVANMYSKSVLRAVAGIVSARNDNVDYFPSYESVTMTRRPDIWKKDLIHIEETFIDGIMERVVQTYVPGGGLIEANYCAQFALLVKGKKWDEAASLYDKVKGQAPEPAEEFYLRAAEFELHRGNPDAAAPLAEKAAGVTSQDPRYYFRCAMQLQLSNDSTGIKACQAKGVELCGQDVKRLHNLTQWLLKYNKEDALDLIDSIEEKYSQNLEILAWLARIYKNLSRDSDAQRLYEKVLANEQADPAVLVEYAHHLFKNGDQDAALKAAVAAFARGTTAPPLAKKIALSFEQSGDLDKAAPMYRILCDQEPAVAKNWIAFARCQAAAGKWAEVTDICNQAEQAAPGSPEIEDFRQRAEARQSGEKLRQTAAARQSRFRFLSFGLRIKNKMHLRSSGDGPQRLGER